MSMQTYRYRGPVSGATIQHNGKDIDVRLHPGKTVQLPQTHEYTQTLVGLGFLTAIDAAPDVPVTTPPDDATTPNKSSGKKGASQ